MEGPSEEQRMIARELLHGAIPINPSGQDRGDYVTRSEMSNALQQLETRLDIRLENSMLKIRNWVITGMLAGAILFGGGFITTIVKLDRLAEGMPRVAATLEARNRWSDEKNQHDYKQDEILRKVDPAYTPPPIRMPMN